MQSRLVGCSRSMPGAAAAYSSRVAGDLEGEQLADLRRRRPGREVGAGDAEPVEVLLRQVDPAAAQVLADVADEVRQLEGLAERLRRGRRRAASSGSRIGTICSPITAAEPYM